MHYAIVINLDYESSSVTKVKPIFNEVKRAMLEAGFRQDGRYFVIDLNHDQTCDKAREVIEAIDKQFQPEGESVYTYIKDFFCFDLSDVTNLLLPAEDDIDVVELENLEGIDITHLKP